MVRSLALLGLLGLLACAKPVETDISLSLPPADEDARARLLVLELELWPPSANACRDLLAWRAETCPRAGSSGDCPAAPSPRDRGAQPTATSSTARELGQAWPGLRVPALDQGPWDLRVRGLDPSGAAIVYGCLTVDPGAVVVVPLWRPWCDLKACAGQLLPACLPLAQVECPPLGAAGAPTCTITSTAIVLSWEEGGVQCPPDGVRTPPCAQASVICSPSGQTVVTDGVCPRAPTCSDTSQACSPNVEPLECGMQCVPDAPCSIERRACQGKTRCIDRQSSVCVFPNELCDGEDQDCDGLLDPDDPDALASCNAGREAYPVADRCQRGCHCGILAPCTGRTTCVNGRCERIEAPDAGLILDGAEPLDSGRVAPDAMELDAKEQDALPVDLGPMRDAGTRDIGGRG